MEQLKEESRKRKNAESRENYWKEKFASEALELNNEDQTDLAKIFAKVKNEGCTCRYGMPMETAGKNFTI